MQDGPNRRRRRLAGVVAPLAAIALLAGCGGGDDDDDTTTGASDGGADLTAVKDYLTDHSADLSEQTTRLRELGEEYYELAEHDGHERHRLVVAPNPDVRIYSLQFAPAAAA